MAGNRLESAVAVAFHGIYLESKDHWTLQWKGLNLYSRGLGPQNSHF